MRLAIALENVHALSRVQKCVSVAPKRMKVALADASGATIVMGSSSYATRQKHRRTNATASTYSRRLHSER